MGFFNLNFVFCGQLVFLASDCYLIRLFICHEGHEVFLEFYFVKHCGRSLVMFDMKCTGCQES